MRANAVPYAVEAQRAGGATGALKTTIDGLPKRTDLPIITEWQTYTPALRTPDSTAVTNNTSTARYRRVGDSIEVMATVTFSGAPSPAATWWQLTLPAGLQINFAKTPVNGAGATVGSGIAQKGLGNNVALIVYTRNPGSVAFTANGAGTYYVNESVPFAFDGSSSIAVNFTVPITGWTVTSP